MLGDQRSPSHNSKMVLSTVKKGPPTRTRTDKFRLDSDLCILSDGLQQMVKRQATLPQIIPPSVVEGRLLSLNGAAYSHGDGEWAGSPAFEQEQR